MNEAEMRRLVERWLNEMQPTPEEHAAAAKLGSEPGAVGYDDAGQLVRVRLDGTREVIPEHGSNPPIRADEIAGMAWWNGLSEIERQEWMKHAGNTGIAADAWAEYKHRTPNRPLHPAELRERREAIDSARASVELEGFKIPPEYLAVAERFAAGEITFGELGDAAKELAAKIKAGRV